MATFFCNSFAGGMNEVIDPSLLDETSAALMLNAELDSGKIKSCKLPLKLDASDPAEFGHYGASNRSVAKLYERTYWSINDAKEAPFYGGDVENYLGIPYPDYEKNVNIAKVDGELSGVYKYCVTFVNANGWESAPGAVLDYEREVKLENQFAKITVNWTDNKISYAKVYRTTDHGADFYCIGELRETGEALTDKITDYTLGGLEPLSAIDNYPPPEYGKYLCESGGVFFLAVGSTLYFSTVGNPHAWPLLNFIGFDDVITGIAPEFQGVLVYTANNTYRITGADNLETVTKVMLPGNQGCVLSNTIAQISNAPVWLSNDGICLWNGESINIISKQIMDTSHLQPVCAVSANDCYYLFLENGAIVFDHRHGDVFSKLDFSCRYGWYDADRDVMYIVRDDGIYLWNGGAPAEYKYTSGFIGLPEAEFVRFSEVNISIEGSAEILLQGDVKKIFSVTLPKSGRYRLKVPFNILARYAQFTVSGFGALREIAIIYG